MARVLNMFAHIVHLCVSLPKNIICLNNGSPVPAHVIFTFVLHSSRDDVPSYVHNTNLDHCN
jgi:hypothetical protein